MSSLDHTYRFIPGEGWVPLSELEPPKVAQVGNKAYNRELRSRANSVHPLLANDHNQAIKDQGLTGVRYDNKGNCYFSSRRARNEFLKRTKRFDMDGGYGDYTGS